MEVRREVLPSVSSVSVDFIDSGNQHLPQTWNAGGVKLLVEVTHSSQE